MSAPRFAIVLAFPRSGGTLLRRILDAHPEIGCPPEPWVTTACARFIAETPALGPPVGVLAGVGFSGVPEADVYAHLRALTLSLHARMSPEARIHVEKSGFDLFHLEALEAIFAGHARFVVMTRHPLDVVASMKDLLDAMGAVPPELTPYLAAADTPLEGVAAAWADRSAALRAFCERHPDDVATLTYEGLVSDPLATLNPVLASLGAAPMTAADLTRALTEPARIGLGDWKIYGTAALEPGRIGGWRKRLPRSLTVRIVPRLAEPMAAAGYAVPPTPAVPDRATAIRQFKAASALMRPRSAPRDVARDCDAGTAVGRRGLVSRPGHSSWERVSAVARSRGETPAILQGGAVTTFAELMPLAERQASVLAGHGLARGSTCILSLPNSAAAAAAVVAVWSLGAVVAFVPSDAPAAHLDAALEATGARLVVTMDDDARAMTAPGDGPAARRLSLDRLAHGADPWLATPAPNDTTGSIVFTSGSSGRPKGVMRSHASLHSGVRRVADALGLRAADTILCPVPWSHDYGWVQLQMMLFLGLPLVLVERPGVGVAEAVAHARPTVVAGVPSLFNTLALDRASLGRAAEAVRLVTSTGAAVTRAHVDVLAAAFPRADIALGYGMTETYRTTMLPSRLALSRPGCVGAPIAGVSVAVLREDGTGAAPHETGEVLHIGDGAFSGYAGDPDLTARTLGSFGGRPCVRTGDLGHLDADGMLTLVGRRDGMINAMGTRVSPAEVEGVLLAHPAVAEAAVYAVPHAMGGDVVAAAVVVRAAGEGLELALRRHCAASLGPAMRPRILRLVPALPRLPSGKTDYAALAWDGSLKASR